MTYVLGGAAPFAAKTSPEAPTIAAIGPTAAMTKKAMPNTPMRPGRRPGATSGAAGGSVASGAVTAARSLVGVVMAQSEQMLSVIASTLRGRPVRYGTKTEQVLSMYAALRWGRGTAETRRGTRGAPAGDRARRRARGPPWPHLPRRRRGGRRGQHARGPPLRDAGRAAAGGPGVGGRAVDRHQPPRAGHRQPGRPRRRPRGPRARGRWHAGLPVRAVARGQAPSRAAARGRADVRGVHRGD